jgi:hypothetical protein
MTDTGVGNELGLGQPAHSFTKLVDPGERVRFAREQQDGTPNAGPVLGPKLLRMAGSVQRIAQQDQASVGRFERSQARHPTTIGMAARDRAGGDLCQERRNRLFGFDDRTAMPGKLDGGGVVPRRRKASTYGFMLTAVPEAPWARRTGKGSGLVTATR